MMCREAYKSTDGILSHCKTVLDVVIVDHGVYHAFLAILRNSSIGFGDLQPSELFSAAP
jgi:hypothetical protein